MKIRSDILRIYQSLHTWTGIGAGMLLFIGFFGGALTMFKQPLERWASAPVAPQAVVSHAPHHVDQAVRAVLSSYPAAREEMAVHLAHQEHTPAPVTWSAGEGGRELHLDATRWHAGINAQGALAVREETPSLLAELIDMLHRTGGIPGTVDGEYAGIYLMGVAGAMYFLALVSGVVLLLPTLVKDFFALRKGKNRKRFWLDAHNVVGIASLPFHLVISLTVVVFAFHDQFYGGLEQVVYGERPAFGGAGRPAVERNVADVLPASELAARVRREATGFEVKELLYMGLESPRPIVRAAVASPAYVVQGAQTGFVMIDPYSGAIVDTSMLPTKSDVWSSIVAPFFALHFGSYGGNTVRWVYFVAGLGGAFLFYSGNLLWIEKRRKNQLRQQPLPPQPRKTIVIAAATVGVCLGSVAGVAWTLVAARWLHAAQADINAGYLAVYYSVFLACVAWAFARGAARAASELLALCAAGALAVPLTSVVALLWPQTGLWAHGSAAAVGVDATALLFAVLLAWAARLSARRMRGGPLDSVWSAAVPAVEEVAAAPAGPARQVAAPEVQS
ncbi:MAG: PepSY domain-containing protein [Burkholderiaceae bacterium]|nr:PepSY domain-containing protein [Burkholderiaceae bacterium]